jgi:hypothetical protein
MTSTNRLRIASALILIAGAGIAATAPWALAEGNPGRGYERSAATLAWEGAAPHILLAVLWLPWDSLRIQKASTVLASFLFVADIFLYLPFFATPEEMGGGDMWVLSFFFLKIVLCVGVLVASAGAAIYLKSSSSDKPHAA